MTLTVQCMRTHTVARLIAALATAWVTQPLSGCGSSSGDSTQVSEAGADGNQGPGAGADAANETGGDASTSSDGGTVPANEGGREDGGGTRDASGKSDASSASGIALGVFVSDTTVGGNAPWTPSVIDNFTAQVGGKVSAWHWYEPFQTGFTQANFDAVDSRGFTPILSWAPSDANNMPVTDANVASGTVDSLLHAFAQKAAAWGKPFYLRLGWEMNLDSIGGWGVGANGNTGASFIAMWQHVHDVVVGDGATNIRWFWCPNQVGASDPPVSDVYPGDAYVDVVGFDAYNWGTTQSWSSWTSLLDTYQFTYNAVAALTSKPLIVGETGSVEQGGDKATWLSQGFLTDLPANFPRIIGVVYFDENAPPDWRVDTSTAALTAFKSVVASPLYGGKLP
jgi:hypothetical protein